MTLQGFYKNNPSDLFLMFVPVPPPPSSLRSDTSTFSYPVLLFWTLSPRLLVCLLLDSVLSVLGPSLSAQFLHKFPLNRCSWVLLSLDYQDFSACSTGFVPRCSPRGLKVSASFSLNLYCRNRTGAVFFSLTDKRFYMFQ